MAVEAWAFRAAALDGSFAFESPGFERLFGHGEDRLGVPAVGPDLDQLHSLVEAQGMSQEQLRKKVHFIGTYASLEQRDILHAQPLAKVCCSLQLAQKQTGDIFVSQVTMFTFESTSGKIYSVSIHDEAQEVTIRRLLDIAGTGEYFVLLRAIRDRLRRPEGVRRVQHLEASLQELAREEREEELLQEELLVEDLSDVSRACHAPEACQQARRHHKGYFAAAPAERGRAVV